MEQLPGLGGFYVLSKGEAGRFIVGAGITHHERFSGGIGFLIIEFNKRSVGDSRKLIIVDEMLFVGTGVRIRGESETIVVSIGCASFATYFATVCRAVVHNSPIVAIGRCILEVFRQQCANTSRHSVVDHVAVVLGEARPCHIGLVGVDIGDTLLGKHRYRAGGGSGEFHHVAPEAHTVLIAAVGTQLHGVSGIGGKTLKGVGVGGDSDQVLFVAIDAELPSCFLATGGPAQRHTVGSRRTCSQSGGCRTGIGGGEGHSHVVHALISGGAVGAHHVGVGGVLRQTRQHEAGVGDVLGTGKHLTLAIQDSIGLTFGIAHVARPADGGTGLGDILSRNSRRLVAGGLRS